jgi:hypothetical protein
VKNAYTTQSRALEAPTGKGRKATHVAIGPRNYTEVDGDGDPKKSGAGVGLRMPKAPADSQCIKRKCTKPLAFAGAELCKDHGRALAAELRKERA